MMRRSVPITWCGLRTAVYEFRLRACLEFRAESPFRFGRNSGAIGVLRWRHIAVDTSMKTLHLSRVQPISLKVPTNNQVQVFFKLDPVLPDTSIRCPGSKSMFNKSIAISRRTSKGTVSTRAHSCLGKTFLGTGSWYSSFLVIIQ